MCTCSCASWKSHPINALFNVYTYLSLSLSLSLYIYIYILFTYIGFHYLFSLGCPTLEIILNSSPLQSDDFLIKLLSRSWFFQPRLPTPSFDTPLTLEFPNTFIDVLSILMIFFIISLIFSIFSFLFYFLFVLLIFSLIFFIFSLIVLLFSFIFNTML